MLKRYAFMDRPEKLHHFYQKAWTVDIPKHFPDEYNNLVELWVAKGYHEDYAKVYAKGCVAFCDPALSNYNETYAAVAKAKKTKEIKLLESLTLPGIMVRIIELAKISDKRHMPNNKLSDWRSKLINPKSEWYHPLFAKDLYKVKPEWCVYTLTEEEQKELLSEMLGMGHIPTGLDPWVVPKEHLLAKFKGTLKPYPAKVMLKQGKEKTLVAALVEKNLKKGIKLEKEWTWLSYRAPEVIENFTQKYPDLANKQKWLKNNLTSIQQSKVDKWNRVAELVLNDVDDYTLIKGMSKEERALVGNHLKMLDQTFAYTPDKARNAIEPIIEKIKQHRPILYKLYCHTKLKTTSNILVDWMRDIENKQKQELIFEQAKQGTEYNDLDKDLKRSMNCFVRKGTRYPEFMKEIKQLRPEWFDTKLRGKHNRERYNAKKKEMMNEQ